ncbi:MAG: UDP-N-acetylmuramoyl-L-alanyl-D-glutamate--2,6-diaminopimelate ligase [Chloroflexi bacterium]|nr:UDP-N-acetylmuramoyl-L-alanyl-D-glutamate--2,6-diaminopimelate ligase [Chloroflexota bacterium]
MGMVGTPQLLDALLADVEGAHLVHGDPATLVSGVTHDSRQVSPGDLFVAVPGFRYDGLEFVPDALDRGAHVIVIEQPSDLNFPRVVSSRPGGQFATVVVPRARAALADLAATFYGHPSRTVPVVGITGTDGKTSTTHLLSAVLEAHGLRTGWLTTVNTRIGDQVRANAADHTTPEAPVVQRTLAEMRDARVDVAILETSSHALALDRVRSVCYRVGVFTNLSPEHINFHGSFEAYRDAKRLLFERLSPDGLAVLNADDAVLGVMRAATSARVITYGLEQPADITARDICLTPRGTVFTVEPGDVVIHSGLIGRFNVSNWLAAYAAAMQFGATLEDLQRAALTQPPVRGRMNLVERGQPFAVVVDFAHTPQALEKALDTVRSLVSGNVLLAFGLAGGRDAANRPVMGALASRKSDFFVISTDDPGYEEPAAIADQISAGAYAAGGNFTVELDRRAAIRLLFERARPGDAVLLAGKGHEQRMVVRDEKLPWNDARVAAEVLADLGFATQAVP